MLLSAERLSINFGSRQLLRDVSFYLNERDKVGIIGTNGTGKSTLLKVLAGQAEPDGGVVRLDPNVQISYLPQNPKIEDTLSVLEQVLAWIPLEVRETEAYEAKSMLSRLGLSNFDQPVGTLSGGQRKRAALAASLLHPGDVLILDEPTNHLDSEMVIWLEDWLRRFSGGLIMVTHDRYFLERVVNHITELSRGTLYHYEANYSRYLELKSQREEMAEASERKRQSILRVEREWIMRGCRARSTKSKDRIERYEALKNQAAPESDGAVQIGAASSRLGKKIITLDKVSKSFGNRVILRDVSYGLLRGDRIGIVGRNGAGKSTLLRLIAGQLMPDSGRVEIGETVKIGHFSQEGRELDLDQRVYDFIHGIADEVRTEEGTFTANQMMERFLFSGELQSVPIGRLSGGERRRLYLLSVLMSAPNVLLLDEPTNDLDVMTLAILEDYLKGFPGPILAVSHDRWFLDKLVDSIFELCGDGTVRRFVGNWSDWAEKKRQEAAAAKPAAEADMGKSRYERGKEKPREKKVKFSYQEEREFSVIDAELAEMEQQVASCERAMEESGSDYMRLQELTNQLQELKTALEEKTERWLYLQELKEKIDAQE